MMSDAELTSLDVNDDEDPQEIIPYDDDETLDDLYMPPCEAGN